MHRWTTTTFKSLCTIPEDEQWIRIGVPRWGLNNEFLLHGIFSLAALEVALCGGSVVADDPKVYFKHALEYYDRASRVYRVELDNITRENLKCVFIFSSIAVLINMAIPQCERLIGGYDSSQRILDRMIALFHLLQKASYIAINNVDDLLSDPDATPAIKAGLEAIDKPPDKPLSSGIETALERANTVIDRCIPVQGDDAMRVQSYRTTVSALRFCFVEDSKKMIMGLCIAFPALAGEHFAEELQRVEPVAMYLMMHWGVLLHHLGKKIWWAKTIGRRLVLEISETLQGVVVDFDEWQEGIAWAKAEVEKQEDEAKVD